VGDYKNSQVMEPLKNVRNHLEQLYSSYGRGHTLRHGCRVALCGLPNAGKSSLFNRLLHRDRALVTTVAGTTRDMLEEPLRIQGRDFVLQDTAGLRETDDIVENLGILKTWDTVEEADIICWVVDKAQWDNVAEEAIRHGLEKIKDTKHVMIVFNKSDLLAKEGVFNQTTSDHAALNACQKHWEHKGYMVVSSGFHDSQQVEAALVKFYDQCTAWQDNSPVLFSQRQRDKISRAQTCVQQAWDDVQNHDYPEKIASSLLSACQELKEIMGDISQDTVLDQVFASFCIGK